MILTGTLKQLKNSVIYTTWKSFITKNEIPLSFWIVYVDCVDIERKGKEGQVFLAITINGFVNAEDEMTN